MGSHLEMYMIIIFLLCVALYCDPKIMTIMYLPVSVWIIFSADDFS